MEANEQPYRETVQHSGVRILLSEKLSLELIEDRMRHPLDHDPGLKAMQTEFRRLYIRANSGDEECEQRLFAIHELLYPESHTLTASVERALELRHLMCQLSYLARPLNAEATTILTGPISLSGKPSGVNSKLYELAERFYKKRATLKSLAIRIFLKKLEGEGYETIDEKSLERDLADLHEWDEKRTGGASPEALQIIFSTDESLPYQFHAQRWRTRKGSPQFIEKVRG